MAKRDVIKYYLQQQRLYLEMLEDAQEFDRMLKNGDITQERFDQATKNVETLKNNYMQISYFMFELNKPNNNKKKEAFEKANKPFYNALKGYSKEALLDESRDALKDFKDLIKQSKEEAKK